MSDDTSVQAAAERIHDAYGLVDLVVNAAGVMLPNPIEAGRADEWARMVDTNINGVLRIIRAFSMDLILAAAQGQLADLVSISSVSAHPVTARYAVYNATEAAITQLSATLRAELGPRNVRVTNIEPGLVRTELGEHTNNTGLSTRLDFIFESRARRMLEAEDVADLIAYITSRPAHVNLRQAIIQPTRATLPVAHPMFSGSRLRWHGRARTADNRDLASLVPQALECGPCLSRAERGGGLHDEVPRLAAVQPGQHGSRGTGVLALRQPQQRFPGNVALGVGQAGGKGVTDLCASAQCHYKLVFQLDPRLCVAAANNGYHAALHPCDGGVGVVWISETGSDGHSYIFENQEFSGKYLAGDD